MYEDLNRQIRRLVQMLPGSEESKFGFNCECGCGTVVFLTAAQFDVDGAWDDGHKPAAGPAAAPAAA